MERSQFDRLAEQVQAFSDARDWGQFHTGKNLSMAIAVEAAELMERYLWSDADDDSTKSAEGKEAVAEEMADILLFLIRMAQITNVDLLAAAEQKLNANAHKYPADLVRGKAEKYTEYMKEDK